ncbi:MAG: hypothetical protein QOH71_748 [Blastocatellia bacterium]|jgi:hypothetical protein|nr:hypothetical protein [Blastocatellia bacterium]
MRLDQPARRQATELSPWRGLASLGFLEQFVKEPVKLATEKMAELMSVASSAGSNSFSIPTPRLAKPRQGLALCRLLRSLVHHSFVFVYSRVTFWSGTLPHNS